MALSIATKRSLPKTVFPAFGLVLHPTLCVTPSLTPLNLPLTINSSNSLFNLVASTLLLSTLISPALLVPVSTLCLLAHPSMCLRLVWWMLLLDKLPALSQLSAILLWTRVSWPSTRVSLLTLCVLVHGTSLCSLPLSRPRTSLIPAMAASNEQAYVFWKFPLDWRERREYREMKSLIKVKRKQ